MKKGNKLIAKFMGGWRKTKDQPNPYWENVVSHRAYPTDKDLIYHKSWDALMPVVEKLEENYDLDFNITKIGCVVFGNSCTDICTTHGEKKIDFVFDAVVYVLEMINKELL